MLKQLKNTHSESQTNQAFSIMGITQWHLRDAIFISPTHQKCEFHAILSHSLNVSEKTFLINLYRAIEKLLKISPSDHLIQKNALSSPAINQNNVIKLYFNAKNTLPIIKALKPILIIDLPDIMRCSKNPAIKAELWKILKNNIAFSN